MLSRKELDIMRSNAKTHKRVFEKIRNMAKPWVTAKAVDDMALEICRDAWVLSAFTGVYGYKYTLQTSVNDVVVHGRPLESIIFQEWDVVTFDFGVKDKKHGICTDAAFTMIIWESSKFLERKEFLEVWKKALKKWLEQAKAGNRVWDIGHAIESYVTSKWYHIIRDLTGHGVEKRFTKNPTSTTMEIPENEPSSKLVWPSQSNQSSDFPQARSLTRETGRST